MLVTYETDSNCVKKSRSDTLLTPSFILTLFLVCPLRRKWLTPLFSILNQYFFPSSRLFCTCYFCRIQFQQRGTTYHMFVSLNRVRISQCNTFPTPFLLILMVRPSPAEITVPLFSCSDWPSPYPYPQHGLVGYTPLTVSVLSEFEFWSTSLIIRFILADNVQCRSSLLRRRTFTWGSGAGRDVW